MASPNLKKFIGILLKQAQAMENAATDVLISRILRWARGAQLDMIGSIVGEARTSLDDDEYRSAIQLRSFINNSGGTPDDMAYICKELIGATSVEYIEVGPAQYRLRVYGAAVPAGLLEIMQSVSPGGVRVLGIHTAILTPFRIGHRIGRRLLDE